MPLRIIIAGILAPVIFGAYFAAAEQDLSALIKTLQQQIQTLQQQLVELQAQEAKTAATPLAANLRRGSRGEGVRRLQEFLKSRPEFYPEGLVTGYFGAATGRAVKRFQKTYGIPAVGIVGSETRAKLNELLTAEAEPQKPEPPATEPPALNITPAPEPAPATTTPPATATTTPAVITPQVLPTQAQLGLPIVSFFGWGQDYLKVQFTHEPTNYTRSYAVYLRAPNQTSDTKFGPYSLLGIGSSSTSTDGAVFRRAGPTSWEWTKPIDVSSQSEGIHQVSITAVGDGGVESVLSPTRTSTLYAKAEFDDILQGAPVQAVINSAFSTFPLVMRLKNYYSDLRYQYAIYDGNTKVWDSGRVRQSTNPKIEVSFSNLNNYTFINGKTYRLKVETFDNDALAPSEIKQKSSEIAITYSQ